MHDKALISPWFIMAVGMPGSGKSTYFDKMKNCPFAEISLLSTDDFIQAQANFLDKTYSDVFKDTIKEATEVMESRFSDEIENNRSFIVDQTNLTPKKRKSVLAKVPDNYFKLVVVFECEEEQRQKRLLSRPGKIIPPEVDGAMKNSFIFPTFVEGWDDIMYVNTTVVADV